MFATCTYSSFLCVCYLHDVKSVLKMHQLASGEELKTFPLEVGSIVGFTGRKKDSEIFYYFTSFLSPGGCRQQGVYFSSVFFFLHFIRLFGNLVTLFVPPMLFPRSHHLPLRPHQNSSTTAHLQGGPSEGLRSYRVPDHTGTT